MNEVLRVIGTILVGLLAIAALPLLLVILPVLLLYLIGGYVVEMFKDWRKDK